MAGALVAISALPASATILSTDILPFVKAGTTDRITAGNLRAQMFAFAATDPLNCGILTAVGNSTITGTLGGITTLSATTGTFTNLTVPTAAQPNITSLGTLTGLNIGADLGSVLDVFSSGTGPVATLQSNGLGTGQAILSIAHGVALAGIGYALNASLTSTISAIIGLQQNGNGVAMYSALVIGTGDALTQYQKNGGQSWSVGLDQSDSSKFKISASSSLGTSDALTITTAGAIGLMGAVTLGSSLAFSTAASQIIPGATSLSFRNNANSADNLLITDAGAVTVRGGLILPGSQTLSINGNQVVASRRPGWSTPTGTQSRTALSDISTTTDVLQHVMALTIDLQAHGLI